MARPRLSVCIFAIATLAAVSPAPAQFGSIFSDPPPRPPADVPGGARDGRQMPAPIYQEEEDDLPPAPRQQQAPYYSNQRPQPSRTPAAARPDQPPAQPLPAPMALPPSSRPGGGTIQSQDLAPPPGTTMAPLPDQVRPPAPAGEQPQLPGQANTNPNANQPADTAPRPGDEVVVEPPPQRIANPTAVFSGLDKITGRIISFDVAVNETVQFGALQVTPRVCYSRPPTETPNTDAFVEVDEVTLQNEIKRIFSGWMFAASPGLHAVEHPIYDVWLTDCKGAQQPSVAEAAPDDQAKPATRPQQPAQRRTTTAPQRAPQQQQPGFVPAQPRAQQQPQGFVPALR